MAGQNSTDGGENQSLPDILAMAAESESFIDVILKPQLVGTEVTKRWLHRGKSV
jgi:hypothetical protein